MTNLDKIKVPEDIHLNIDETYDFIHKWLPPRYSTEVNKLLDEVDRVDNAYVRQVKKERINNPKIYTALYRIALFHKMQIDKISS